MKTKKVELYVDCTGFTYVDCTGFTGVEPCGECYVCPVMKVLKGVSSEDVLTKYRDRFPRHTACAIKLILLRQQEFLEKLSK